MKKKDKTKKVITICITVIMMLCVFVVPSNAATYQPVNDYNIIEHQRTKILNTSQAEETALIIVEDIVFVFEKIYNISEVNINDIFVYEREKTILRWTVANTIYVSTKVELISNENRIGYLFYDEEKEGDNILFIGKNISQNITEIQISSDNGQTYDSYISGTIYYANSNDIEVIPPSFVDHTTTGMKTVLGWVAMPFNALINGGWNSLLILFAVGIAISGVLIAVKIIKKFIWGD